MDLLLLGDPEHTRDTSVSKMDIWNKKAVLIMVLKRRNI